MRHMPTVQIPVSKLSGYILTVRWRVSFTKQLCPKKDLCSIQLTRMPSTDPSIISTILSAAHAPIAEDQISGTITNILSDLLSSEKTQQVSGKTQIGISEAISHINKYFYKSITLQELADIAALSPYYFSRVFARETGMTPHKYLISTRMANAKFLLKTSQMSVKEIAIRSGFSDESGFCTAFKKQEGMTPKEYRSSNC